MPLNHLTVSAIFYAQEMAKTGKTAKAEEASLVEKVVGEVEVAIATETPTATDTLRAAMFFIIQMKEVMAVQEVMVVVEAIISLAQITVVHTILSIMIGVEVKAVVAVMEEVVEEEAVEVAPGLSKRLIPPKRTRINALVDACRPIKSAPVEKINSFP